MQARLAIHKEGLQSGDDAGYPGGVRSFLCQLAFYHEEVLGPDVRDRQVADVAHEPLQVLAVLLYRSGREAALDGHVVGEAWQKIGNEVSGHIWEKEELMA